MGVLDTVKKIIMGDVAHDAADAGNPVKIGGKARTAIPTAVANSDRVDAYFDANGRMVVSPDHLYVSTDANTVSTDTAAMPRMTQYRETIVAPNVFRAQYFDNSAIANPTDITVGTTNWYTGSGPTTAFFNGSDVGFTASTRFVQIPMHRFSRGVTVGIFNALGVSLTVHLRVRITSYNTSNAANGWRVFSGSASNNTYIHFSPMPLHASAQPEWNYVPQLNSPMEALVLELTPASDPSSGYFILTVGR